MKPIISLVLATACLTLAADINIPCTTPGQAKALAERETLGEAVTVVPVLLPDGSKGWEVLVHRPGRKSGRRCIIDQDMGKVRWVEKIKNPPSKVR